MSNAQNLIRMLQSEQPKARYDACEQLMLLPVLTKDVIDALNRAAHDGDVSVAKAAKRALELHKSDVMLSQETITALDTPISQPKTDRKPFLETFGELITKVEEKYLQPKHGENFSRIGMSLTFFGASVLAIVVGLILYWMGAVLKFHIPFIFPLLTSVFMATPIAEMGKNLGHCRNLPLAVGIPVFASVLTWVTEHYIGSFLFHTYSNASLTILKTGAMILPITFTLNGFWSAVYWAIELIMIVGITARANADYPFQPYCETCKTWRKFKTPLTGTNARLEQVINALKTDDVSAIVAALTSEQDGNVARLNVEYCPNCYSDKTSLVVVSETSNDTWEDTIVWNGMLNPKSVREIVQRAN